MMHYCCFFENVALYQAKEQKEEESGSAILLYRTSLD